MMISTYFHFNWKGYLWKHMLAQAIPFLFFLLLCCPGLLLYAQPAELALFDATYNSPKAFTATQTISVGPNVVVDNGGDVTLGAPSVFLLNDVHVKAGGTLYIVSGTLSVNNEPSLNPAATSVFQNYPNPVRSGTRIHYRLEAPSQVEIHLYDSYGRSIRPLLSGFKGTGTHVVEWDGTDQQGNVVAAGMYFYRFVAGDYSMTKRLMVVR